MNHIKSLAKQKNNLLYTSLETPL